MSRYIQKDEIYARLLDGSGNSLTSDGGALTATATLTGVDASGTSQDVLVDNCGQLLIDFGADTAIITKLQDICANTDETNHVDYPHRVVRGDVEAPYVLNETHVYAITKDVGAQKGGQCLLRTRDITDPGSWRAWNGSAFSVAINISAEIAPVSNPDAHTCTVINLVFVISVCCEVATSTSS